MQNYKLPRHFRQRSAAHSHRQPVRPVTRCIGRSRRGTLGLLHPDRAGRDSARAQTSLLLKLCAPQELIQFMLPCVMMMEIARYLFKLLLVVVTEGLYRYTYIYTVNEIVIVELAYRKKLG